MSIRLGANPIIWSNDDMRELGAETSLETCLAEARQIGFEGMELGHKFPRDVFTVPGDGSVAFERVFRELRNYSGWVILEAEQDPRIADPMTYASIGYNNLRRLLSESAP